MKQVLIIITLFLSTSVIARALKFDINLKVEQGKTKRETSSQITSELGNKFFIEREDIKAEFVAREYKEGDTSVELEEDAILVEAKITQIINGVEKLLSQPKVITVEGKQAILTIEDETGHFTEIKITPSSI